MKTLETNKLIKNFANIDKEEFNPHKDWNDFMKVLFALKSEYDDLPSNKLETVGPFIDNILEAMITDDLAKANESLILAIYEIEKVNV
jgi:hypothetical protein